MWLQVVNVVGPDHSTEHTESHKESRITGKRWRDMDIIVPGTMPDG
jgi:hypothetical protein